MADQDRLVHSQNANDHLANERTLLAWIRTSIAIMAFGFVVVKFSIFLKQMAFLVSGEKVQVAQNSGSHPLGIGIVIAGVLVLVLAYLKYKQTEKQLLRKQFQSSSTLILLLVIGICVMSVFLILYLMDAVKI